MVKLRLWLGVLIWWLFLFYNIERVADPINLSSFVYALVPAAVAVMIFLPRVFQRIHLAWWLTVMILVFFALKAIFAPPVFGNNALITVAELSFFVTTLVLTHQLIFIVWDFEDTIANLTFRQIGLAPRLYETTETEDLYREVKRSRRYRHPLALLAIEPVIIPDKVQLSQLMLDLQRTMATRYIQARLARLLSEELRDIDLVVIEDDRFFVMLPETSGPEGEATAARLQRLIDAELGLEVKMGSAIFPEQAITFGSLIDVAVASLEGRDSTPEAPAEESGARRRLPRRSADDQAKESEAS